MVDAMVGLPRAAREDRDYLNALLYGIHSPPIVVRDKVIHGSQIADRRITKEAVPGWVRAWDVRTGEHAWDFHTVPNSADEFGVDTWGNESWRYSGNANVWSMLAGDDELGHVYLPTGTATNDYYGVDRPGDNRSRRRSSRWTSRPGSASGTSRPCTTGCGTTTSRPTPTWSTWWWTGVHPGHRAGEQAGLRLEFDRATGDPIWPLEERPVPQETNMPGEVLSPTQPFPTKPAPFDYQGVTIDDLVRLHAGDPRPGRRGGQRLRDRPLFTPPTRPIEGGTQGTLMRPPDGGTAAGPARRSIPRPASSTSRPATRRRSSPLYAPDPASAPPWPTPTAPGGPAPRPARRHPGDAADAAGPAAPQAALLAHDGHRPQHRRAPLVGPDRQRRPLPQPPAPAPLNCHPSAATTAATVRS